MCTSLDSKLNNPVALRTAAGRRPTEIGGKTERSIQYENCIMSANGYFTRYSFDRSVYFVKIKGRWMMSAAK